MNIEQKRMPIYIGAAAALLVIIAGITLLLNAPQQPTDPSSPTPTPIARPTLPDYSQMSEPEKLDSYLKRETAANAADAQIQAKFPWLNLLPIQTPDYFLYFDVRNEQFTALIYAPAERQVEIRNAIETELQNRSIPTQLYEIQYIQK